MLYAGMTFFASLLWSITCFAIYLLLSCDGGMVVRWILGMFVISMYKPSVKFVTMNGEQFRSFLLVCVGVASATSALLICIYLIVE